MSPTRSAGFLHDFDCTMSVSFRLAISLTPAYNDSVGSGSSLCPDVTDVEEPFPNSNADATSEPYKLFETCAACSESNLESVFGAVH